MLAATSLLATTTGKSLFSQHYLETRLPGHPEWAEDPQAAFDAVQALWHKARQYGQTWNEAQTEDEFVKPVLAALGWSLHPFAQVRDWMSRTAIHLNVISPFGQSPDELEDDLANARRASSPQ